ncbi:LPXTG cell wall anchor domain-containing protein [Streptomyces sp. NPDC049916]|uniref:LPXTG cell wall anchor domain-containing protein n=1 Tax=Streptomyces sp. NPDC049916 TaxID=3155156 RepID=UPI003440C4C6
MKIRRALAVAAATAVLAPVTLLSAPVALATPGSTPETTESSPAPEGSATSPAPEGTETSPAPEATVTSPAPEQGSTSPAPDEPETAPSPSATTSATSPAPSPSSTSPEDICDGDEDPDVDENLRTSLSGLPSKIVAGSGFHAFKLNVTNKGDQAYDRVDVGVFAAKIDDKTWNDSSGQLTLQFKDPETGAWTDIVLDEENEASGYLGYTAVRAKESFSVDLRVSVDKKSPAGSAFVLTAAVYADADGGCTLADSAGFYEFAVLAAGAEADGPNEAEPQEDGRKPLPVKPEGDTPIKPEGTLAQTGSDSRLPLIATIGGVAVLAGAGVVFTLGRRRRGDATA